METNLEQLRKKFFRLALLGQDQNQDAKKILEKADLACEVLDASARAYGDMRRTIKYRLSSKYIESNKGKEVDDFLKDKANFKANVTISLNDFLNRVNESNFDSLHDELCDAIIEKSEGLIDDNGLNTIYYGQAQKWVNMFMKYMLLFNNQKSLSLQNVLHVPIDSYIIDKAKGELDISKPEKVWSKLEKQEYKDYQKKIINKVKGVPIIWEMDNWGKTK